MWHKFMDTLLRNRIDFDDKEYILKKALKRSSTSEDVFNKKGISDCCGYYTYIYGRDYNFRGLLNCSKCNEICSYKK